MRHGSKLHFHPSEVGSTRPKKNPKERGFQKTKEQEEADWEEETAWEGRKEKRERQKRQKRKRRLCHRGSFGRR